MATEPAERLLEAARQALGGDALAAIKSIHIRASLIGTGFSGTQDLLADAQSGHYVESFDLGAVSGARGWDGRMAWSRDAAGQVRRENGRETVLAAIDTAFRLRYAAFIPARRQARIAVLGMRSEAGRRYDVLRIAPRDGRPYWLWLDRTTHLPARLIEAGESQTTTQLLEDYRSVGGIVVPFRLRQTGGGVTLRVKTVTLDEPIDPARFQPPAPPAIDYVFPAGLDRVTLPFELANNHIWVKARINGQGPFSFIFDTGAAGLLSRDLANKLVLPSHGRLARRGIGESGQELGLTRVDQIDLGGVILNGQLVQIADLAMLGRVEGRAADGLLGYDFVKRFVTSIDYQAGQISFYRPPARIDPPPAAIAVPFHFNDHIPEVEGRVDGMAGRFLIDTGSRSGLVLLAPFVARHHLLTRYHAHVTAITGWGLAGPTKAALAPARRLRLGAVESPVGAIELARGAFASRYEAGSIGGGVLRQFNLTLDYARQIIWFQRNAAWGRAEPPDRSGLWLNQAAGGLVIEEVVAGSAAALAGLRPGDRVIGVDGRAVESSGLPDIRRRLKAAPGSRVGLEIQRGNRIYEAVLILADPF